MISLRQKTEQRSEGRNRLEWQFASFKLSAVLEIVGILGMASICLAQGDTWAAKADMPTARLWFSCEVVDGKIYVIGGATRANAPTLATVEEYDPVSDTWTSKQDMPTRRTNMASAVVDENIYVIGGDPRFVIGVTEGIRTLEVYDRANDTWETKAEALINRSAGAACVVGGIIYVMGGVAPGGVFLNAVEAYDPAADTWSTKAPMQFARHALNTAVVNGKIYAMGGGRGESYVEEYDPATDTWATKTSMPVGNGYFGTGIVDGIIYTMGGSSGPGTPYSRVFAYDALADEWTEKTSMPTARFGLGAGVVNGKIYTLGGAPGWPPDPLSVVEEYTPETSTSVENNTADVPISFELYQNHPNPFNPETVISYLLSAASEVELAVYDLMGRHVVTLVQARKSAGSYQVTWNGRNAVGEKMASGVYLYRLRAESFVQTRKMVLVE